MSEREKAAAAGEIRCKSCGTPTAKAEWEAGVWTFTTCGHTFPPIPAPA